jgi:hypothetical protein
VPSVVGFLIGCGQGHAHDGFGGGGADGKVTDDQGAQIGEVFGDVTFLDLLTIALEPDFQTTGTVMAGRDERGTQDGDVVRSDRADHFETFKT